MTFIGNKNRYKSRRERYERDKRNTKVILLFIILGLIAWLLLNRQEWWGYLKTYFY